MLDVFEGLGYIVNVGQGILPDPPVEHVRALEAVKGNGRYFLPS